MATKIHALDTDWRILTWLTV